MNISPQSQAALDTLSNGGSLRCGGLSVGPFEWRTVTVLRVLVDRFDDLVSRKGDDQARALCQAYVDAVASRDADERSLVAEREAKKGPAAPESSAAPETTAGITGGPAAGVVRPGWRLHQLRCKSIRGIAPLGEEFVFDFDGLSHLIYGPNGSGKTSLVGTAGWVMTGRFLTDVEDGGEDRVGLYTPEVAGKASKKLCDWFPVHTLPAGRGDVRKISPDGWAQIELRSSDGARSVWFRRRVGGALEVSIDGSNWNPCDSLEHQGIGPLDVQLSFMAPSVFSRHSLERAPDAGRLISLLLGYDTLEAFGELAGNLGRNRTSLAKAETDGYASSLAAFRQEISSAIAALPDGSPLRDAVAELAGDALPPPTLIDACARIIADAVASAEANLAAVMGVTGSAGPSVSGLADALTHALLTLERGFAQNFPSFAGLAPTLLPLPPAGLAPSDWCSACSAVLDGFLDTARVRISARLRWWRDENRPSSKATLLLQAAKFLIPGNDDCPVCEKPIDDLRLKEKLEGLRPSSPDLSRPVRDFFRDLGEELKTHVPDNVIRLSRRSPSGRLLDDWEKLTRETVGPRLAAMIAQHDDAIRNIAARIKSSGDDPPNVIPDDAEPEFRDCASGFVETLRAAWGALAIVRWAVSEYEATESAVSAAVLDPAADGPPSLLDALALGRSAASSVKPLTSALGAIKKAADHRQQIAAREDRLKVLEELTGCLDAVKLLTKFAAGEAGRTLGAVRSRTIDVYNALYPEAPKNLAVSRLVLGPGKNRTVAAYLAGEQFEAPSEPFANAGQRRAVALAFFFALLDEHPGGLGFVVLDDPLLSLDDDHRESWSCNVLKPRMGACQFIVATHQRHYLNHCRHDFRGGRIVELNTRSRSLRLSWRPGDRLDRAEGDFQTVGLEAFNGLRKYVEEVLATLSAYSPESFFNSEKLRPALDAYAALKRPHPLAGAAQKELAEGLKGSDVEHVLNAGSHAATEVALTEPMFLRCLEALRECDKVFRRELDRLDRLRTHASRNVALSAPPVQSPVEPRQVGTNSVSVWASPIPTLVIGRAAAQTRGCVVDISEAPQPYSLGPGEAVLVGTPALEPVARPGQWAILAPEEDSPKDGDLVAAEDRQRSRWLRRVWSDGDRWIMESINPVADVPAASARKTDVVLRKVVGVVFEPERPRWAGRGARPSEWQPRGDFDPNALGRFAVITVDGSSLEPIARHGHAILVGHKATAHGRRWFDGDGSLVVLETDDERVGNVVKRAFLLENKVVLISPNPVEPHQPIVLAAESIAAIWPVKGVLHHAVVVE